MKRYDPIIAVSELGEVAVMDEDPDGEYYSRADLIAAGVLVPVPDGEAIENCDVMRHAHVLFDGEVWEASNIPYELRRIRDGERIDPGCDVFVQPVRLVPLEEVG